MSYESPAYDVERRIGPVEVRRYQPYVVAETTVSGPLDQAGNRGFRVLAKFIFGGNRGAPDSGDRSGRGAKIAMTTPVMQEPQGEDFRVQFMMPAEYDVDSVPLPDDDRVEIRAVGERRVAALRYSGRWTKQGYERCLADLLQHLDGSDLRPAGKPMWARYDPPWKPWFLRRNEVLIAVEPTAEEPS